MEIEGRSFERVVVWFSCGVTSAVAAKMTLSKYKGLLPVEIIYTDPGAEHKDNFRFMKDCEKWFGQKVKILKSEKYEDIWDVFEKTRYLAGVKGARCTTELKKKLRQDYQKVWSDIQVFGFDSGEKHRAEKFRNNNPEVYLATPLIDENISKPDSMAMMKKAGIELPITYKMGYRNANCIGCPKGQSGYWNKIRIDFPEVFKRMSAVERKLNVAINKSYAGDKKRKRVFLDELDPDAGRYNEEPNIECGLLCNEVLDRIEDCET